MSKEAALLSRQVAKFNGHCTLSMSGNFTILAPMPETLLPFSTRLIIALTSVQNSIDADMVLVTNSDSHTTDFLRRRYDVPIGIPTELRFRGVFLHAQSILLAHFREFIQKEHGDLIPFLPQFSFQDALSEEFVFWLAFLLSGSGGEARGKVALMGTDCATI